LKNFSLNIKFFFLLFMTSILFGCGVHVDHSIADRNKRVTDVLDRTIQQDIYPGIQYIVVDSGGTVFGYFGGWADIQHHLPMDSSTTMMAYSMTKTFTAAAVMQLVEQGKISLDESVCKYFPSTPYGRAMTVRQLLSQTSGIPDPIPLRWVHPASQHASFDENRALENVLLENAEPKFPPGTKYAYSNISYWILGKIIEKVSGQSYPDYMSEHIFSPLGLTKSDAGYTIPDVSPHAKGYLRKYSFMNLIKGLLIDKQFIGEYDNDWLHINDHHLNGPGFGGLVTTAKGVAAFLRDQLRERSALLNAQTRELFFTQQKTASGEPVEMTLGWHIGTLDGEPYFYKEGGGGGYHAEMRIYAHRRRATVIMVNETSAKCVELQSELDREFVF
jgi:CubicO group peptidase (beta-lactamase class C family)